MSQTDKMLTEISEKMDKILRLLAVNVVKGMTVEQEKIELLDSLGFRPIEIANMLNKTSDNVRVQLSYIRKKKTGGKVKSGG
jgi:DNA-directed RNA polymerase specialized sigma24 family protein